MVRKEQLYVQCNLRRKVGDTASIQTSWIPEQFAVKDKYLRLKNADGVFEDHWQAVDGKQATDEPRPLAFLDNIRRASNKTRVASDI